MSVSRRVIAVFFCVMACITLSGAHAYSATKITAVVNDQAVTSYDIAQRAKLISLTTRRGGAAARREAMNELIDDKLKLAEARRIGISVSDAEIDDAYANIAKRVKLSTKGLTGALRQSGVNPNTLKDRLRAEIAWSQVIRARFRATVKIREADVIAALQKNDDTTKNTSIEYALQAITVVVPAKASASLKAQRKRDVNNLRSRFLSCTEGAKLARGMSEVVVQPIRRRLEVEIPSNVIDDVKNTSVGRLTPPQTTEKGYELIAVCDKRELQSDASARIEMEDELRNKEGQQMSRKYLRDLKRQAVIEYR